ncbi:hypothetical protein [Actinomadura harenae]|uniref:Uncharacterized protein n=1 Tax=Actinomadura harenae TaxID=2483351 RepID=A0A3M2M7E9_9ACTN|nr:hypothetical protein [Actinomadura harenae]RMI45491.1 hypothetical protein EBO15_09795 [Actinomadura harenae]
MGTRARWDETYQALLPQALRPVEETRREFREAVFHAWLMWHGETSSEQLDSLATDDEIRTIRALEESCSLGWRNALLGRTLAEHGHEVLGRPNGGPHGLWGVPACTMADQGFRPPRVPVRRGTLRDVLASARNQYSFEVDTIRDVHASLTAVPVGDRPPADRVREVVTRLCLDAWHKEVEVDDRCGWDDAEWWQYLNLEDLLTWTAVALGLPGEYPEKYGDLVDPVAGRTAPDPLKAWHWQAIPSTFVSELGDACVDLALTLR